jgi:hypothetical protein
MVDEDGNKKRKFKQKAPRSPYFGRFTRLKDAVFAFCIPSFELSKNSKKSFLAKATFLSTRAPNPQAALSL